MEKEVGIWVDHRKAVIVTIKDEIAETREITSNMEKHVRFSGSSDSNTSDDTHGAHAEDMRDRKFGDHLNQYYDGIISLIRDAESIWIFGPGEAKSELENRLKKAELGARIVGIYPVDKMTTPQIIAKVHSRYLL
jgi:hypothetical protein